MKITIQRELLEKKLQIITGVMSNSKIMPIYNEALIEVEKDRINITATDGCITLSTFVQAVIEDEPFNFIGDVQMIFRTITSLRSDDIILDVTESEINLSTPKTRKKYSFPISYQASSFPRVDNDWNEKGATLPGDAFSQMIKSAASIVNPNNLRPGMSGVCLSLNKDELSIKSCHEAMICINSMKMKEESDVKIKGFIIPKSSTKIIGSFEKSTEVKLSFDKKENNIKIEDGVSTALIRLINGVFPEVNDFFKNANFDISTTTNRIELINAVRRVSAFTNVDFSRLVINYDSPGLHLSGADTNYKKQAEEEIEASSKASEMKFATAINHSFLMSALNNLTSENIVISQLGEREIMFLYDAVIEKYTSKWIIMPMTLK